MSLLAPLEFPCPWPPPDCPSGANLRSMCMRVPFLGWLLDFWWQRHRHRLHISQVLMPIERQIVCQLIARSPTRFWINSPSQKRIVELIADAVAKEKGLQSIVLHPDDPIELLFWGAYDDMSPLRFVLELRKKYRITLSAEDVDSFFIKHMTVSDVISFCLTKSAMR